jgi:CRISPR system Cascade subunit CasB
MEPQRHDFMMLYEAWKQLKPGPKAELRRVSTPEGLFEVPAYYRLIRNLIQDTENRNTIYRLQRLVFCLPFVTHTDKEIGLGAALAGGDYHGRTAVSDKRLFQILRSETPNDLIQLRRILKMVEPDVHWPLTAGLLWYWNERSKRQLLEDYFLNQPG